MQKIKTQKNGKKLGTMLRTRQLYRNYLNLNIETKGLNF